MLLSKTKRLLLPMAVWTIIMVAMRRKQRIATFIVVVVVVVVLDWSQTYMTDELDSKTLPFYTEQQWHLNTRYDGPGNIFYRYRCSGFPRKNSIVREIQQQLIIFSGCVLGKAINLVMGYIFIILILNANWKEIVRLSSVFEIRAWDVILNRK